MTVPSEASKAEENIALRQQAEEILAQHPPVKLNGPTPFYDQHAAQGIDKAGLLIYRQDEQGNLQFYLMKPKANHPELGDPGFQIAKGTREIKLEGEWMLYRPKEHRQLVRKDNLEPLAVNALREAIEEAGLKGDNVASLQEWGRVNFKSAVKGNIKSMWLYLAEVKEATDFYLPADGHANTVQCEWFTPGDEAGMSQIRPDHREILETVAPVLERYLKQRALTSAAKKLTTPPGTTGQGR